MTQINAAGPQAQIAHNPVLKSLADKLEAQFLSEMLKTAGVGQPREFFGGGIGESQFSGFLADEYAKAVVDRGGLDLSEAIYNALVAQEDGK